MFFSKIFIKISAVSAGCLLISGCLSPLSVKPVNEYDIGLAEKVDTKGIVIEMDPFINISSTKRKFLYRKGKYQLEQDNYNKWAQPPEFMLSRFVDTAFLVDEGLEMKKDLRISGNIIIFEFDLDNNQAVLAVDYRITELDGRNVLVEKFCIFRHEFKNRTPNAFVEAARKVAESFVLELARRLKEINDKHKK